MSPIDSSIDSTLSVLEGLPVDDPRKYRLMANLGRLFFLRFEDLGLFSDIDKSVSVTKEAIQLIPDGHSTDKAICLSSHSDLLFIRFELSGILADLDKSISAREASAALTPDHDPNKLDQLAKLGNSLSHRFHNSGELADLNTCISTRECIIQLIPENDAEKYIHLNNLAKSFYIRFKQLSQPDNLDNCISASEEAVRLLPDTHENKPDYLSNLGSVIFQRFQRSDDITANTAALKVDSHASKFICLNNLTRSYLNEFQHLAISTTSMRQSCILKNPARKLIPIELIGCATLALHYGTVSVTSVTSTSPSLSG